MKKSESPVTAVNLSKNSKTGKVSATYAPIQTCPDSCPLKNSGCYGQSGPCGVTFTRISDNTEKQNLSEQDIAEKEAKAIDSLNGDLPLRLHVTGDCPNDSSAKTVSDACERYMTKDDNPVWAYTHTWENVDRDSWGIVNVLASCESSEQVRRATDKGYSVAWVTPLNRIADRVQKAAQMGLSVSLCQNFSKGKTCTQCRKCFNTNEKEVVIIPTHGIQVKKADQAVDLD